jgi:DNA-binding MltR family transcriptional regulator
MTNNWDPDIAEMDLSAAEKDGMQFYRNFSTAIESKRVDKLVERLNEIEPAIEDFKKFASLIPAEQPLSVSVIACAYADDLLKQMFKREIPSSVPGGRNELLNGFGPLSRLSQRIQVAYAFRWMNPDILVELDLLRRIRNDISHKWDLAQLQVKLQELAELRQHPIEEYLVATTSLMGFMLSFLQWRNSGSASYGF